MSEHVAASVGPADDGNAERRDAPEPEAPPPQMSMRAVGRSAAILTLGTLAAQMVVVVRELFLASQAGASSEVDALLVGIVLPVSLGNMLASGSAVALVPAYMAIRSGQGLRRARLFSGLVVTWIILASLAVMVVLTMGAEAIVGLTGSGLSAQYKVEAVDYLRIVAPSVVAFAAYGILSSVCQAEAHFGWMAMATIAISAVSVAVMFLLWSSVGLLGYAFGTLIGPFVGVLILLTLLIRSGLAPRPTLRARGMSSGSFIRHALPLTISSSILQLNLVTDTAIASHLAPGGVAALRYGQLLINVPVSAMGIAWSRAIYPALVHSTLDSTGSTLAATAERVLRFVLAMFTPIAFLTAALAPLIVGIAYGRGAFGAASAELTSVVVLGLAPTIVISMASPVLTGSLNARRKGTLLLAGGVLNVTLNLVFNVVLGATMGLIGIALSSSAATALVLVFFARRLSRMEDGLRLRPLVRQVVRTSLAAIPGIVPLGLLVWALPPGTPLVQSIILAGMVTVAGLASYLVMSAVLQVREPLEILAVVRSVAVRFITSRRPA